MHRRDFIRLAGGGVIVSATALGLEGCAPIPDARAAWNNPGAGESDIRRKALAFAILAPNPHNMQPWLADLKTPGEIALFVDPSRLLPQTDPFNRQIVIGCGAFLELLRMAAAEGGYDAQISAFPEGEPAPALDGRPVARVSFKPGGQPDSLFRHTLARRTARVAFDGGPVAEASVRRMAAEGVAGVFGGYAMDAARLAELKAIAKAGARRETDTPAAHHETCERTFIGAREVAAHRYGIALEGPALEAAHAVGLLTQKTMADPKSWAFKQAEAFMDPLADSAQAFVWLKTATNTRADQIAAGRAYMRQTLAAVAEGLAVHPFSQALQEYETMKPLYGRLHRALAPEGGRVQMLVRVGHVKSPLRPAPRRGLAENLKA